MKYIRLIPTLLLGTMLTACNTTKKLYEAQEYDQVIQRLAPDICDGDMNASRINMVAASYHKANQADHERIQALKASGQPDIWPEIYQRYCSMKGRNDALKCFPTKVKNGMNYVKLDHDDDMVVARNHAEAFLVAKANQLLNTGSAADALEADNYIEQLWHTNKDNISLPELQKKSLLRQAERVLVSVDNDDERPLLRNFIDAVLHFDAGEVPANVVSATRRMHMRSDDAEVRVVITDIQVTPDRLDEVTFKETNGGKTVEVTDHSQNKTVRRQDRRGDRPFAKQDRHRHGRHQILRCLRLSFVGLHALRGEIHLQERLHHHQGRPRCVFGGNIEPVEHEAGAGPHG